MKLRRDKENGTADFGLNVTMGAMKGPEAIVLPETDTHDII